jgi:hypothetical protein
MMGWLQPTDGSIPFEAKAMRRLRLQSLGTRSESQDSIPFLPHFSNHG